MRQHTEYVDKHALLFQGDAIQQSNRWVRCFIFAGFVAAMSYVFAITGGNFRWLIIVQGAFIFWVMFALILRREKISFPIYSIFIWWLLGLVLLVNLFVNAGNYSVVDDLVFAATHVVGILAFAFAAQWAANNLYPDRIFKCIAWMLVPLILWVLVLEWEGGNQRAEPLGVHPNWWGEMAFGFIVCTLSMKKIYAKAACIIVGLVLMYAVQSRGALFAALVSIFSYWFLQHRPFGKKAMKKFILSGVIFLASIISLAIAGFGSAIVDFFEQRVLLLDNPYRGLGTGLTGRAEGWEEALKIFMNHPIFGQGFDTLTEVHNGFLRFAAEGGVLLLGSMTVMIVLAMVHAWRQRNDLVVAALFGSIIYLLTYPRGLNLNTAGVVFLLSLFPWRWPRALSGGEQLGR
jgi:O-antigen ligase